MKKTISESEFIREFEEMNRENNFSIAGRRALYNFLEEWEEDIGEQQELDIIAICCDFTEYENIEEFVKGYGFNDILREDYEDEEEFYDEVKQHLQDNTIFIDIDGESFIIQGF